MCFAFLLHLGPLFLYLQVFFVTLSASSSTASTPLAHAQLAPHLEPFITQAQLEARIAELAKAINQRYAGVNRLVVVGVLKGSVLFLADLLKQLDLPLEVEFIQLSSYGKHTQSSGQVAASLSTLPNLDGQHVLIVEDIVDTGLTLRAFMATLAQQYQPASIEVAALLDKPSVREATPLPFPLAFVGFAITNQFVVGYGLDLAGYFRNLPYIAVYTGPAL